MKHKEDDNKKLQKTDHTGAGKSAAPKKNVRTNACMLDFEARLRTPTTDTGDTTLVIR